MFVNACIQVDFFLHAAKSNINTPTTAKHQDLHASTDTSSLHSALKIKGGSDIYWGAFFFSLLLVLFYRLSGPLRKY